VTGIVAPHFVDLLMRQVKAEAPDTREDGLAIYTTLDPDMQAAAQAAFARDSRISRRSTAACGRRRG